MALQIDSPTVLRAIADHPDTFAAVRGDIDEFARKLLAKQLKHKTLDLPVARGVASAVGRPAFATVLDSFASNEMSALLKKLDANNEAMKGDDAATRAAVEALVEGRTEPTAKAAKAPKAPAKRVGAKAPAKPKIGDLLGSKVHAGDSAPPKKPRARKAMG